MTETDVIILPLSYGHESFIYMWDPGSYTADMRN